MLYINANEEKRMVFEVQINGVDKDQLQGEVKFSINGVQYGFPAIVETNRIETIVPPLSKVVGWDIEDGSIIEARLDLHTDVHFFTPWEGEIKIGAPMQVKAKLESENKSKPRIKTTLRNRQIEPVVEEKREPNMAEIVSEVLKRLTNKEIKSSKISKKKVTNKLSSGGSKTNLQEIRKLATKENIYKFMEKKGTKNKKIQNIIYEQAVKSVGGESDNLLVLKKVIDIMRIKGRRR
jgi:hypothetical protein